MSCFLSLSFSLSLFSRVYLEGDAERKVKDFSDEYDLKALGGQSSLSLSHTQTHIHLSNKHTLIQTLLCTYVCECLSREFRADFGRGLRRKDTLSRRRRRRPFSCCHIQFTKREFDGVCVYVCVCVCVYVRVLCCHFSLFDMIDFLWISLSHTPPPFPTGERHTT